MGMCCPNVNKKPSRNLEGRIPVDVDSKMCSFVFLWRRHFAYRMIFFTCMPLSVVLIDSGGAGSNKETMSECVARRHQLPLMEKTELNIVC